MATRREFFGTIGRPAAAALATATFHPTAIPHLMDTLAGYAGTPEDAASDETLWREIQQAFTVDRTLVNLNNGGVSPAPSVVQEAMKRHPLSNSRLPGLRWWLCSRKHRRD